MVRARPHAAALTGRALLAPAGVRGPLTPEVPYDDAITAPFLVSAVAAALAQRRRTGLGCRVEASAHALCAHQLAPALLAATGACRHPARVNGDAGARQGVIRPAHRPLFAITLFAGRPRATRSLAGAVSALSPCGDRRRAPAGARIAASPRPGRPCLSRRWGGPRPRRFGAEDLLARDRQLTSRGALVQLTHPQLGRFVHQASPYPLGSSPASLRTAPLPGQHTEYVCRELLGLDADLLEALHEDALFF